MPKPSPEKEAYWRKMLSQQRRSGQNVRQFCQDHNLPESSFHSWKREIARRDQEEVRTKGNTRRISRKKKVPSSDAPLFIPLQLADRTTRPIELTHPRGHVLRIPGEFQEESLAKILALLDREA